MIGAMTDTNAPTEQQGRNRSGTAATRTGSGSGGSVADLRLPGFVEEAGRRT